MSLRMVVIDDEVFVRKGVISSIAWDQYGIEIVGEAMDGMSGLELVRQTHPHIILTDIRMPRMDGLEMIRVIRGEFPEMKILILSVKEDFQTVREALRLGVVDYVQKLMMTPEELLQTVLKIKETIAIVPNDTMGNEATHRKEIRKAIEYVFENFQQPLKVKDVAERVNFSENYFSYLFTKETGKPFSLFLQETRVKKAAELLRTGEMDWNQVGEEVGFENPKYFTKVFKKYMGMTPMKYRQNQ